MDIRILIDKLGPITNSEITLKPFMVFTGESGLGKSYTAFLVYNLTSALTAIRMQEFVEQKVKGNKLELDVKFKDFRLWLNNNTSAYLGYLLGYSDFSCHVNYVFDLDDDMPLHVKCLDDDEATSFSRCSMNGKTEVFPMHLADQTLLMSITLNKYLAEKIFNQPYFFQLLLPPARAAFIGSNTTTPIGMYREFLRQFDDLKTPSRVASPDIQLYSNYIARLVDGKIVVENGNIFIVFESGAKIPVSAAASSVKELMPFLLMLQNGKSLYNSMLFEEPEAHVHPKKQSLVMDMLARCINNGMMIQMTTHSDYMLNRMNQLLMLGEIRKVSPQTFDKFCEDHHHNKKLYLDRSKVGSCYFKREGEKVTIEEQQPTVGLPLTTFDETVRQQIDLSATLDELAESIGIDINM